MAKGSSRALPMRPLLAAAVIALAHVVTMPVSHQLRAQTEEGTVRLTPTISSIPADSGPFTVFVVLENLRHFGALSYDDNRDTVPDRQVASDGLGAFQLTIEYDRGLLELVNVQQGPDLGRTGRAFQCLPATQELSSVTFGCVSPGPEPAGPQGTLTLGLVTFQPVGSGSSPLVVRTDLTGPLGDPASVAVRGGVVQIVGRPAPKGTAQLGSGTPTGVGAGATPAQRASVTVTPRTTTLPTSSTLRTPTALTPGNGAGGGDPSVGGSGGDARGGPGLVWLGVTVGGMTAGILALAAVFWQRQRRAGL